MTNLIILRIWKVTQLFMSLYGWHCAVFYSLLAEWNCEAVSNGCESDYQIFLDEFDGCLMDKFCYRFDLEVLRYFSVGIAAIENFIAIKPFLNSNSDFFPNFFPIKMCHLKKSFLGTSALKQLLKTIWSRKALRNHNEIQIETCQNIQTKLRNKTMWP